MRKTRLLWQLYPSYLLITLASLLAVGWFATYSLQEIFSDTVRNNLQQQLHIVDDLIGAKFDPADRERCVTTLPAPPAHASRSSTAKATC
jgi:two-component system phosphate regulon sensor histidine kinase PhoR